MGKFYKLSLNSQMLKENKSFAQRTLVKSQLHFHPAAIYDVSAIKNHLKKGDSAVVTAAPNQPT